MARKPTPEERIFAAGFATGARRGRQVEREEAIRDVAAGLLADDVSDAVRLVEKHGAKKAGGIILEAAKTSWPTRWRTALGPLVLRVMHEAEIVTDRGPLRLGFDVKSPKLAAYFDGYMIELSGGVTETTREKVTNVIREGLDAGEGIPEIAGRVRLAGEEFSAYRSELIGRTETLNASRGSSHIQARESGVVKSKRWITAGDARVREEHVALDGSEVGLDESFANGEVYPSSPMCRCSIIYNVDMEILRGAA